MSDEPIKGPEDLAAAAPLLADALESDRFKQFLDHIPFAVIVAELQPAETITYANLEFERLMGLKAADIEGKSWEVLPPFLSEGDHKITLTDAVTKGDDYVGTFAIEKDDAVTLVDVWSNVIENDEGGAVFRLVSSAAVGAGNGQTQEDVIKQMRDKDVQLRELQHRVKNNLQMVTALIRMEARNMKGQPVSGRFDLLAGRVNALALLYDAMAGDEASDTIDLGVYISRIASAVMQAHATEGVRLDMMVDAWPVSINVAMPTGLVVNELLTNALKHAFTLESGGTITVRSLVDEAGCTVTISDDGVGMGPGETWPKAGKLSALIVQSLRQNAKARVTFSSEQGAGTSVSIYFARENAAPESA